MKKYVVASISFLNNEIKQTIQISANELDAFKKHMLTLASDEEQEDEWQKSEDYPQTYEDLLEEISNWDMDCSVIEIS